MISAALTLNGMDIAKQLGRNVSLAENANPSFKDGSAAMLSHPEYLTDLLYYNRKHILENIKRFEGRLDHVMDAIRDDNTAEITSIIEQASEIRRSMPAHKGADEMRRDRVVNPETLSELPEYMQRAL